MSDQQRNYDTKDLISGLPSNITEKILAFMPIRDAVRTSILSTNWRYKWTSLPQLVFDFTYRTDRQVVINTINEILLLHDGSIRKFSIVLPGFSSEHNRDLGRWMLFLSRDGVREISLENSFYYSTNIPRKLPSSFFSCQELTYLDLRKFIFEPPRVFVGFKHLTSLDFHEVVIATDVFETLVSAAPHLERLTCILCSGLDHVNFHAPTLKYMQLKGEFKSIYINQSPHLSVASIDLVKPENYMNERSSSFNKLVDNWPRLKKLVLGCYALKVFAMVDLQEDMPHNFHHLEHLHLDNTYFKDADQFFSALCLIRSSPNLQKLEISDITFDNAAMQPMINFMEEKESSDCSQDQLRTVSLTKFKGSNLELQLIKYLLSSSPVLETMIVQMSRIKPQVEVKLTRKLLQFRRLSPKAEVVYL